MATVPRLHKETSLFDKSIAQDLGEASDLAKAASPKSDAIKRTQRIWYRKNSAGAPSTPGTASSNWVTKDDDGSNAWTKMHVAITETDKYIYTCEQYEMANGTVGYTSVLLDNTITVIDGGNIITGTVMANAVNATSGTFDSANIPNLDASKITTGQLSAERIDAESLTIGYSQIDDPPSIPSKTSDLTNDSNFATTTDVQNAAKTATNYLTTVDNTGLFVHRANDTNSGVKITDNVDIVRGGISKLHIDDDSVDINDSEEENITRFVGSTEEPSEANGYQTIRNASVEMGNSTLGTALFKALLVDGQATETTYEYKGTTATIEASRDIGEPVDLIARIVAQVVKEYNTSRSAFDIISTVKMQSDYLDVTTRTGMQVKRIDMDSIRRLVGCRIDIAFSPLTVNANSGGNMVFNWVNGGFRDKNYIVSFSRMSYQPSYDHVEFAVVSRTETSVTVAYWNSAPSAITDLQVGLIGVDSRYGSTLS